MGLSPEPGDAAQGKTPRCVVRSRLVRGEAEVSQMPSEEEMTHRADLPCRGLRPSLAENCRKLQKTKGSQREDRLQRPGGKPPFFPGSDGPVMAGERPQGS